MIKHVNQRLLLGAVFSFVLSMNMFGQEWVDGMLDPSVNFYTVQQKFEEYWKDRPVERSHGYKQFRRWEAFMTPRVFPTGERPNPNITFAAIQQMQAQTASTSGAGNWSLVGPVNGNAIQGIGRVNAIAFHPIDTNTVYIGAPAGGLWKSIDGGITWTTNTDMLPNLGVSAIAIDPQHPDTMYIGTGDRDAGDTYAIGVLKSTDGGQTWNTTGLSWSVNLQRRITGLHINPKNTQEVVAATRSGMYRSANGGITWTLAQGGSFQTVKSIPSTPDTLIAGTYSNARIWRSTDAGASWTMISSNLPTSGVVRVEIATTADDNNYVYALYSANNNGLYGLYRSTDGGVNWSQVHSSSPNMLDYTTTGSGTGGQGWYDLAIDVNPKNKNEVFVGGVNIWMSSNGGTSFNCVAHWYGGGGLPYVHADQHVFKFKPSGYKLYIGCDGGVWSTPNGLNWTAHNNGLAITQYYRIATAEANTTYTLAGAQDNGTHLKKNGVWDRVGGGDGMDCAINNDNPNIMYSSIYYGDFEKSVNAGASFNASFNLPPAGTGNWITPLVLDPGNQNIVYAGFDRLWKSTNGGISFTSTSNAINGTNIDVIALAASNPNVIYVGIQSSIYKSINGGANWTNINGSFSGNNSITGIAVDHNNANHLLITTSGYNAGQKVFESVNGGISWNNITGNIPNIPANCVAHQIGSNNGWYVGTDIGIYYKDASMTQWTPFMNGLPNTIVNDIEILPNVGKIRIATYGRGVWESDLFNSFVDKPIAAFAVSPSAVCSTGDTVSLFDLSQNIPTDWEWTISPSTYTLIQSTLEDQNPKVVFNASGTYSVQLIASNYSGRDTAIMAGAIHVGGAPLPYSATFDGITWNADFDVENPDASRTWIQVNAPAGAVNNGDAVMIDLYNYSALNATDALVSIPFDLTGLSNVHASWNVAYARRTNWPTDSLIVWGSDDCGDTWVRIASYGENGTGNFATTTDKANFFSPSSSSEWRKDSVSLAPFIGQSDFRIKFESKNSNGNAMYLDNFTLRGTSSIAPVAQYHSDTLICTNTPAHFFDLSKNQPTSRTWYFPGGSPATSTAANPLVTYSTPGTYSISLVATNGQGSDSTYFANSITVLNSNSASVTLSTASNSICQGSLVTFTATPVNGGVNPKYYWTVNGAPRGNTGNVLNISTLNNNDTVQVSMISSEACISPFEVFSNPIVVTVNQVPTVSAGTYQAQCQGAALVPLTGSPAGGTFSGTGVVNNAFNPSSVGPGTYTLTYTYTNASGCTNSSNSTIQVLSSPNVFLTLPELCVNDGNTSLNGGFPLNGVYVLNGDTITSVNPQTLGQGDFYITYQIISSNGCLGITGDTLHIRNTPPTPTISVFGGDSLVCDQLGYQYQWLNNGTVINGATNRSYNAPAPGKYAVRLRTGNACTSISSYTEVVSIDDLLASYIQLDMYPNPTSGRIKINYTPYKGQSPSFELVGARGEILKRWNGSSSSAQESFELDLTSYAAGMYILRIQMNDMISTQKIVKQ